MLHTDVKMRDDGLLRVSFTSDTGKQGAEALVKCLAQGAFIVVLGVI